MKPYGTKMTYINDTEFDIVIVSSPNVNKSCHELDTNSV